MFAFLLKFMHRTLGVKCTTAKLLNILWKKWCKIENTLKTKDMKLKTQINGYRLIWLALLVDWMDRFWVILKDNRFFLRYGGIIFCLVLSSGAATAEFLLKHYSLKSCWNIFKAKEHAEEFVMSKFSRKCSFWNIVFVYFYLMKTTVYD